MEMNKPDMRYVADLILTEIEADPSYSMAIKN